MVVLAASVCTSGGKPIISRQFKELTKERVTSLLSNFPTLLAEKRQSQHTAVEDEYVRYIYQPLEEFYVVLITNKHSNILQDIDTLHLFSQSITSILRSVDEREIFENCFELLGAFDEIICLGYKENLSASQIMTFLEMDSHEERIQEIIERNKELEAAEESKKKAAEIQFKEFMKKNSGLPNNGMSYPSSQHTISDSYPSRNFGGNSYETEERFNEAPKLSPLQSQQQLRKGGMQLGKKSSGFADNQPLLVNTPPAPRHSQQYSSQQQESSIPSIQREVSKPQIPNNGILFTINEKYSAQISREGTINSSEVKGDLQIRINDSSLALAQVKLSVNNENTDISTQYKTHPNVDKKLFNSSSIIGLKDPTKPFPSNDQNLGVLRWRSVSKNNNDDSSSLLPITVTTWVNNNNDGTISLTFEYENDTDKCVDEININIPIINASISADDDQVARLSFDDDGVCIELSNLIEHSSGSFEILCKDVEDEEALFPMELSFNVTKSVTEGAGLVKINDVVHSESSESLPYDIYVNAASEGYYIV